MGDTLRIQPSRDPENGGYVSDERLHASLQEWLDADRKRGDQFNIRIVDYEKDEDGKWQVQF